MSDAGKTAETNQSSPGSYSSGSSPPSKDSTDGDKSSQSSPPAPGSSSSQTNNSTNKQSTPPPPNEETPKASPPPPPVEKKPPPPPPNPPPKQSPKSSPPPSPPSSSEPPPSPPRQQSPPEQPPSTPDQKSSPQPPPSNPTQQSPSTPTPTNQQSQPSPTPNQKPPPSPSNQTPPQNTPSASQPSGSSSGNNPSSPSSTTSQSPQSTNSTSTPQTSENGSNESMPGVPPQTLYVTSPPLSPISPSNSTGGSSGDNNSGSSNTTQNNGGSKNPSYGFVLGVAVTSVVVVAIIVFLFLRERRKNKQKGSTAKFMATPPMISVTSDLIPVQNVAASNNSQSDNENSSGSQRGKNYNVDKISFSYEEMTEMTDGFAQQNLIGEGGFGCVYRGQLPDGKIVAVKKLKIGGGQGEREFQAEVEIISRVHHRHLVSLVGYCIANNQRLLIYEFVSNSTLERHLHDKERPVLEWNKRLKIAVGASRGLAYLHEDCHPKIIHRDIKSANILLDEDFEAQVADFGLARLNDTSHTHVSTRVMGTFGYLAPEYASTGKLTDRSDVFSFGVVLLELLTGRKPVDPTRPLGDESLVEWARPLLIEALDTGDFGELIDPRLEKCYVESEVFRMIEAAAACVRNSAARRPRMALVARALDFEGSPDLSNGVKFGQSNAYDSSLYSEEITKFRQAEFSGDNSSQSDIYSDEFSSRELSRELLNSNKPRYHSGESRIGTSETRGSKPSYSGHTSGGSGNYGDRRFR
ncbi:hypothetical protein HRI_002018800 [Hibiscus trionum]|uniref:non-specific serine/threonine protein kinase n=1 Tax=Hibiscus trionum TaxID=183268 RepID=A0A9W7M2F0_HIBTR|nr:hypothetical protein HRI_002018800 [Hibiscus trionum]